MAYFASLILAAVSSVFLLLIVVKALRVAPDNGEDVITKVLERVPAEGGTSVIVPVLAALLGASVVGGATAATHSGGHQRVDNSFIANSLAIHGQLVPAPGDDKLPPGGPRIAQDIIDNSQRWYFAPDDPGTPPNLTSLEDAAKAIAESSTRLVAESAAADRRFNSLMKKLVSSYAAADQSANLLSEGLNDLTDEVASLKEEAASNSQAAVAALHEIARQEGQIAGLAPTVAGAAQGIQRAAPVIEAGDQRQTRLQGQDGEVDPRPTLAQIFTGRLYHVGPRVLDVMTASLEDTTSDAAAAAALLESLRLMRSNEGPLHKRAFFRQCEKWLREASTKLQLDAHHTQDAFDLLHDKKRTLTTLCALSRS